MHRRLPVYDNKLEALRDQRDHLAVQISLMSESGRPDYVRLEEMLEELRDFEKQIAKRQHTKNGPGNNFPTASNL